MTNFKKWKMACGVILLCTAAIAAHAQVVRIISIFDGTDGSSPNASVVQGRDGNFYGTTPFYGVNGDASDGTVFKVTSRGTLIALYSFCSQQGCADGSEPVRGVILATDGDFYGTTQYGGANNGGTVFKITPAGTLTTLYSFCAQANCADGDTLSYGVIQATDGNFYGMTYAGGAHNGGTVFKITPAGTLRTLYSFCAQPSCTDGSSPIAVIQATDGNFYGTTEYGGANNGGTVFKITPAGTLTTLYSFCAQANCSDGSLPQEALIQASDGNFYGTTSSGGNQGGCWTGECGTVFKVTPRGALTTLYAFCATSNCSDGVNPGGPLVQATDGNLYGTTSFGGAYGGGTAYSITLAGTLTTLHSFLGIVGQPYNIAAGLLQGTRGNFYGATYWGGPYGGPYGSYGDGTIFTLSMGLGPFVTFVRASGKVGTDIEILGQGFTGTTSVTFNAVSASFAVKSDTFLTAEVPTGATTGYVTVTTPTGTLTSNKEFIVKP